MKELKADDEVFNLLEGEWGVLVSCGNGNFPIRFRKDGDTFTLDGRQNYTDKKPSLLSYNPLDPDDPKNRDMPDWMQRYHGMRKELQDIRDFLKADENESTYDEVVRALSIAQKQTHSLEEVKRKIYAREMAIENDDEEILIKCCKVLWPKTTEPSGGGVFYYQNSLNKNTWYADIANPFPSSILATDLVKLIHQSTNYAVKPPLGLIPKHIHDTMRKKEILGAMQRYTDAGKAIPVEWLDELRSLA